MHLCSGFASRSFLDVLIATDFYLVSGVRRVCDRGLKVCDLRCADERTVIGVQRVVENEMVGLILLEISCESDLSKAI